MRVWLLLMWTVGCKEPEPWCVAQAGASVTVCTVDETDEPLTVREVVWFRDTDHPDYDGEHPAACADDACSLWAVEEQVVGELMVAARYYGPPHHDPLCAYLDDATAEVEVPDDGAGAPVGQLVTLALDTTAATCDD